MNLDKRKCIFKCLIVVFTRPHKLLNLRNCREVDKITSLYESHNNSSSMFKVSIKLVVLFAKRSFSVSHKIT